MTPEHLMQAARDRTGLEDFGDEPFMAGLATLADSIAHDGHLKADMRPLVEARLEGLLAERLRVEEWYRQHPEIASERVRAPIWIVGLPRTGSTALADLLTCDPARRVVRTWESNAPTPPPDAATQHNDPRIAAAESIIELTDAMAPHLKALYPATATGPTEHQDLMGMAFCTNHFKGLVHVPSYEAWLLQADFRPAFRYHQRVLQLLQWRCPPRDWLLKCPSDLIATDALLDIYPDARLVWTHRDPVAVMASVCTLIGAYLELFTDDLDRDALGRQELSFWVEATHRALATRDTHHESFVDVYQHDLHRNPMTTISNLYEQLDEPLSPAATMAMGAWIDDHPRRRFGEPTYRLTDWGLDADEVRDAFRFYTDRFAVPLEEGTR